MSSAAFASGEVGAIQICPARVNAIESPLGESDGDEPSAILRGAPPSSASIQIASSAPPGRSAGFGRSPAPFAPPPRTYTTDLPSGVNVRLPIS